MADHESPTQPKPLTAKQRRFVDAYVGEARFNASRAALDAGYADAREGWRLLKNAEVRARIEEILEAEAMSRAETLSVLTEDALRTDDDILDIAERAPGVAAQASAVSALISARTTARTNLAKAHSLLTERKEISGPGGGPIPIQAIEVVLGDEGDA